MISAIVLAGGNGSRMKSNTPKQFMMLGGKPLIWHALNAFQTSIVDEIILVTRGQDVEYCKEHIIRNYSLRKVKKVVAGGENRYDSVWNGIKAASSDSEIILIHDGARPFVTEEMIEESIKQTEIFGACTVGVPVKDTIKVVDDEMYGINTPDRRTLYQIQTPQTFKKDIIESAYISMHENNDTDITDDTMIVERYLKRKVKIIPGSYMNIKVTTGEDIVVASALYTR